MYIDTHCHLTMSDLEKNLKNVVNRAEKFSVERILTMGTDLQSTKKVQKVANSYDSVFFAAGIHPEECMEIDLESTFSDFEKIKNFYNDSKCVAVGEIGLDNRYLNYIYEKRHFEDSSWKDKANDIQKQVFKKFLNIALEFNLPASIHCRESEKDMFEILDSYVNNGGRGVLHSFTGNIDFLNHFLNRGFFVSFNGIITFKNGVNVCELLEDSPLDQIILETDSPFLAPVPYRGNMCEPAYVVEVYKKVSNLKNIKLKDLEKIIQQNVARLFNKMFKNN